MSMTICGFNATMLLSEMNNLVLQKGAISTLISKLLVDLHQSIPSTQKDSAAASAIDNVRVSFTCWEVFDTVSIDLLGGGSENLRFNHEKQMPDGLKSIVVDLTAGENADYCGTVAAIMSAVDSRLCLVEEWSDRSRKASRKVSSAVGNLFITADVTQVFGNVSVGRRVERSSKLTIVLLASTNSYALSTPATTDTSGKSSSSSSGDRFIWISRSSNKFLYFDGAKPQNVKGNSVDHPLFCNLSVAAKVASLSGAAKALSSLRRIVQIRRQKGSSVSMGSGMDEGSSAAESRGGAEVLGDLVSREGDIVAGKAAAAIKSLRRGNDERPRVKASPSNDSTYTPYRDSLLTMMLKPTLSEDGNCFMAVVTTFSGVSSSDDSSYVSCCRSLQFISEISNLYNRIWSTDKVFAYSHPVAGRPLRSSSTLIDTSEDTSAVATVRAPAENSTVHAATDEVRGESAADEGAGRAVPGAEAETETLQKFNELQAQFQAEMKSMLEHHMKCIELLGIEITLKDFPQYMSGSPVPRNGRGGGEHQAPAHERENRRVCADETAHENGEAGLLVEDQPGAVSFASSGQAFSAPRALTQRSATLPGSVLDAEAHVRSGSEIAQVQISRAPDLRLASSKSMSDPVKATLTIGATGTPTRREVGTNLLRNSIKSRDTNDMDSPQRSPSKRRANFSSAPESSSQGLSPSAGQELSGSADPALGASLRGLVGPSAFPVARSPVAVAVAKKAGSLPPITTQQRQRSSTKPPRQFEEVSLPQDLEDFAQREKGISSRGASQGKDEASRDRIIPTREGGLPSPSSGPPSSQQQQRATNTSDENKQQLAECMPALDKKEIIADRGAPIAGRERSPHEQPRVSNRAIAPHHGNVVEKSLRNTQLAPISDQPTALAASEQEPVGDSISPTQPGVERKPLPAVPSRSSSKSKASKAEEASADADSAGDGLSDGERKFLRFVSIGDVAAAEKCLLRDRVDVNVKNTFSRLITACSLFPCLLMSGR